jgi:acyl carrier protein
MDTNQFIENFLMAVDFIDPIEVTLETAFADMPQWDSVAALGVIVMSDMEYQVVINGDDLKKCVVLGDLAALIVSRQK